MNDNLFYIFYSILQFLVVINSFFTVYHNVKKKFTVKKQTQQTGRLIEPKFNYTTPWLNQPNKQPHHNPYLLCEATH